MAKANIMMTTWLLCFVSVYGDTTGCEITATATSGGEMEVVPVSALRSGSKSYTDRDYTFSKVGSYPEWCWFIISPNDDKNTAPDSVQTSLEAKCDSTVYLDFQGGSNHVAKVSSWINDWNEASEVTPTTYGTSGPGIVMKRDFDAGTINLMGNNGAGHGTYYTFVCLRGVGVDFNRIDKDGDGMLNYNEVAFDIADVNKDGLLSKAEYHSARFAGMLGSTAS